jgi:hypothetical protein
MAMVPAGAHRPFGVCAVASIPGARSGARTDGIHCSPRCYQWEPTPTEFLATRARGSRAMTRKPCLGVPPAGCHTGPFLGVNLLGSRLCLIFTLRSGAAPLFGVRHFGRSNGEETAVSRMTLRELSAWVAVVAMAIALFVRERQHASEREGYTGENLEVLEQNAQLQRDLDEARGEGDGLELEVRLLEAKLKAGQGR